MSFFNFNDSESQKQIGIAMLYRNPATDQLNADALASYAAKQARLVGSRREWELEDKQTK